MVAAPDPTRPADLTDAHVELIHRILASVAKIAETRATDPTSYPYLRGEGWTEPMADALVEQLRGLI